VITNIHRRALKTQIRTLSIEANHGTVNPLGSGRVVHRAIIGRRSRLIRSVRSRWRKVVRALYLHT
jgi:hypothetical protein